MKKYITLSISEYSRDGYQLNVRDDKGDLDCPFMPEVTVCQVEIDITPHLDWLVQQGNKCADKLKASAQAEFNKKNEKIKDFESKFLLIGADS